MNWLIALKRRWDWLEEGIERTLWLKLLRLALFAAIIVTRDTEKATPQRRLVV